MAKNISNLKTAVRTLYDMQKQRIQMGNRLCASFRSKLGLEPSQKASEVPEADNILKMLRDEYSILMTDRVARVTRHSKFDSKILTNKGELDLIAAYEAMVDSEKKCLDAVRYEIESFPVWTDYLKQVRGCGELMAAVIISEFDITKSATPSAFWMYAGLDVVVSYDEDGNEKFEARSKKAAHLVDKEYVDRDGKTQTKKSITFNPFLKTKLLGVLGASFIKLGGEYREIYDGEKNRLINTPRFKDESKAHIHNMAVRYMIKQFTADLHTAWRIIEGLPARPRYAEEKLGIVHSKDTPAARRIAELRVKYGQKTE